MKPNFELISEFYGFLSNNDALELYEQNCQQILFLVTHSKPDEWITGAFIWCYTPQKHQFWMDINDKWWKFIDEQQTKNGHTTPENKGNE